MKSLMKSKLLFIAMLYICCMLLEACNTDDCNFTAPLPFFTFETIDASPSSLTIDAMNPLSIEIALQGIDYVAFQQPSNTSFFSTSMYGCSPVPAGFDGLKNPMTNIDITAVEDFDDMHLAGSSLNELFEVDVAFVNESSNLAALNAESNINSLFNGGEALARSFVLQNGYPTTLGEYNFLVKLTFESGDPIELALETVTFE